MSMIKTFTLLFIGLSSLFSVIVNKPFSKHKPSKYPSDTSRLYYYSFLEDKVIDLKNKNQEGFVEKIEVSQGAKVVLEAPIYFTRAIYYWEGPDGFRSYLPKVEIDQIALSQAGVYSVMIKNAKGTVNGKIEVKVNTSPETDRKNH